MRRRVIKAIIFDCFGVLASDSWADFGEKYLTGRPVQARRAEELNRRSDMGLLSHDEWVSGMAVIVGVSEDQVRLERRRNADNDALLVYIADNLRAHYRTGLVSNVGRGFRTDLFRSLQGTLFDEIVLSYKVGVTKPDERIYLLAAERLGVEAGECLFIDDRQVNVDGASEAGMRSMQYKDFESFTQQLEEVLNEHTSHTTQG